MLIHEEVLRLLACFPDCFINSKGEFFPYGVKSGHTFFLKECRDRLDIQCKVLEWLTRDAFKTEITNSERLNKLFHAYMLRGINAYLGTCFSLEDMETLYTYLGNACNHPRTLRFIKSGFNIRFFDKYKRRKEP